MRAETPPDFCSSPLLRSSWNRSKRAPTGDEREVATQNLTVWLWIVPQKIPSPNTISHIIKELRSSPFYHLTVHRLGIVQPREQCDGAATSGQDCQTGGL